VLEVNIMFHPNWVNSHRARIARFRSGDAPKDWGVIGKPFGVPPYRVPNAASMIGNNRKNRPRQGTKNPIDFANGELTKTNVVRHWGLNFH
jgi:hypothetical protein